MHDRDNNRDSEPIELTIDGILDLHTFNPRDVKELLPHYIEACKERGISEIRLIHGKGTGALRTIVHSILDNLPGIESYKLAGGDAGGWGATLVKLKTE